MHIDATYKLIDLGYPVVIVGTNDTNKHFYMIGICIFEVESAESYIWYVEALKEFYNQLGFLFLPIILLQMVLLRSLKCNKPAAKMLKELCVGLTFGEIWANISQSCLNIFSQNLLVI
ncbi:hypothetical protein ENBRE01_1690 [Enteropsectra breve]|nr:hypothetical protein ENBRE01_1690 [Enteropsectra breve]